MPSTNFTIMKNNKDKWIDLVSLAQRFYPCEDCKRGVIEDKSLISEELYLYNLRIALRSVGHKITKISKCWNKDGDLDVICYKTTINEQEYETAMKWFDDWIAETTIHRHENESESESESDNENDDPSV